MQSLLTLKKYYIRYWKQVTIGMLFVVLSNLFKVISPTLIRRVLDNIVELIKQKENIPTSYIDMSNPIVNAVLMFCLLYFGTQLVSALFTFLMRQTIIVTSRKIEQDLKNDIYAHYQKMDLAFYKQHSTGDMMSRITEDVSRVREVVGPAVMYSVNLVALIVMSIVLMLSVNIKLTIVSLIPLPFLSFLIYAVNKKINKNSTKLQAQLSTLTTIAQEVYSGIRIVKSFVKEQRFLQHFSNETEVYKNQALKLARIDSYFQPLMMGFVSLSTILTVYVGALEINKGNITAGNIAEFIMYVNMLMWPVTAVGWVTNLLQRGGASMTRINEFLELEPTIENQPTVQKTTIEGNIVFENVSFTYPDSGIQALKNVSFELKKGERLAILGKTGSGKSTIAELILRLYDTTSGSIKLDGIEVRKQQLHQLRSQIGYVPQDVFLFSDSIENNIAFGVHTVENTAVREAARSAAIADEINSFTEGYNTVVGERGVTLSGGQKQRISLARALIKNPQILILDDCLSAVDVKTEHFIAQELDASLNDKTVLIITHRILPHFKLDKIIMLEDGVIAEMGTPTELLALNGLYAETYHKQITDVQNMTA